MGVRLSHQPLIQLLKYGIVQFIEDDDVADELADAVEDFVDRVQVEQQAPAPLPPPKRDDPMDPFFGDPEAFLSKDAADPQVPRQDEQRPPAPDEPIDTDSSSCIKCGRVVARNCRRCPKCGGETFLESV